MRRLLYCGEWIESHAPAHLLPACPDFLGFDSGIDMRVSTECRESALRIKRAGNEPMSVVGGRSVHPVNVKVGGFHRMPTVPELAAIRPIWWPPATRCWSWCRCWQDSTSDFEQPYLYVSLGADNGYPLSRVRWSVAKDCGHRSAISRSTSSRSMSRTRTLCTLRHVGQLYVVGPLARYSLHADALSPLAAGWRTRRARAAVSQPVRSILVRTVELVCARRSGIRSSTTGRVVSRRFPLRSGRGSWRDRAPRGLLYHRYRVDESARSRSADRKPHISEPAQRRTTCGCSCRTASTCLTRC